MEDVLYNILTDLLRGDIDKQQAIGCILGKQRESGKQLEDRVLDLSNWLKSELAEEKKKKLGKFPDTVKIEFLSRMIKKIEKSLEYK